MSPVFYQGKDSVKAKFHPKKRPLPLTTIIGSDVWIGEKSLIKQGVSIGNGAVIGMGSVVTRDVQPYSIVAGVPAKEIRKRFEESIIQRLQKSEWWSLEDKQILELAENFDSPEKFLKSVGQ
jgi:serine acetyltransferase